MTIAGTVQNGVVILDGAPALPDGTRVEVVLPSAAKSEPTLAGLLKLSGTINDLPPDMAEQHDHYIHGTPRK